MICYLIQLSSWISGVTAIYNILSKSESKLLPIFIQSHYSFHTDSQIINCPGTKIWRKEEKKQFFVGKEEKNLIRN